MYVVMDEAEVYAGCNMRGERANQVSDLLGRGIVEAPGFGLAVQERVEVHFASRRVEVGVRIRTYPYSVMKPEELTTNMAPCGRQLTRAQFQQAKSLAMHAFPQGKGAIHQSS